jgi:WD40 repeat protein
MGLWFRWEPWALERTFGDKDTCVSLARVFPGDKVKLFTKKSETESSGTTHIVDLATGADICSLDSIFEINFLAQQPDGSPDGRWFVNMESNHCFTLRESQSGTNLIPQRTDIGSIQFSKDSRFALIYPKLPFEGVCPVFSLMKEKPPEIWDLHKKQCISRLCLQEEVNDFPGFFCPDGNHIIFGDRLWNTADGKLIRKFNGPADWYRPLFSQDGKWLLLREPMSPSASTMDVYRRDWHTFVFDFNTGALQLEFRGDTPAFHGDTLVVGLEGVTYAYQLGTTPPRHVELPGVPVSGRFSSDGRCVLTINGKYDRGSYHNPVFQLCDISTGEVKAIIKGCVAEAFFPDALMVSDVVVISTGWDMTMIWDTRTGATKLLPGYAAISPDKKRLIVRSGGSLLFFDLESACEVCRLNHVGQNCRPMFSDSGAYLIAQDQDRAFVYHRRRPDYWWGLAWLPEFWLTLIFSGAFAWSIRRDRRELYRRNGEVAV